MAYGLGSATAEGRLMPDARISGPVPWVIAIMIFLMILAAAAALSLRSAASSLGAELAGRVTVQIVTADPDAQRNQADKALAVLRKHPLVTRSEVVPENEINRLLAPWLGSEGLSEEIVLPAMIDLDLGGDADANALKTLRSDIAKVAPDARIDAHASWLRPLSQSIGSLQWLALGIALLMGVAGCATVILAARTIYASHASSIDLIHLLGATDSQIAALVQRQIALNAGLGGFAGAIAAGVVLSILGARFAELQTGLLGSGLPAWQIFAILVAIPLLGVALAMVTAHITVMRALRKSL